MKTEKVFKRKKELIKRDPAYHELLKVFDKIVSFNCKINPLFEYLNLPLHKADPILREINHFNPAFFWNRSLDEYKYNPDCYPNIYEFLKGLKWKPESIDESAFIKKYDNFIERHKIKYPDHWKLDGLIGEIKGKWYVNLDFNFSVKEINIISPLTNDEALWVGSPPVISGHDNVIISDFNKYPQLNWLPYPNPFNKKPVLADINEFVTPGYNETGETYIPIVINLSRLNNNDAKQVKKTIWEIIKSNLQKGVSRKLYDGYSLNPEFAFLYGIRREDTFHKYLWWYDIRTKEKLSFRLIALIDKANEKNPQRALELLKKFSHKKVKWGISVKGEDKIEKGVKLIYKAIHRIDYSTKEQEAEFTEYSCPTHKDNNCPPSCKYHTEWLGRFNRLMP